MSMRMLLHVVLTGRVVCIYVLCACAWVSVGVCRLGGAQQAKNSPIAALRLFMHEEYPHMPLCCVLLFCNINFKAVQ